MDRTLSEQIKTAAALIKNADGLLITAGAGLGVDSGLPDFRGPGGFWRHYPALGKARMDFGDIACPDAFVETPKLAWGFYGHRLNLYRKTPPGKSYELLLRLAQSKANGAFVLTSNVDGHFQRAGFAPDRVCEIHGSIHYLQCIERFSDEIWSAGNFNPSIDEENCLITSELPQCRHCGGIARPNILMFGDWGWNQHRQSAQYKALTDWLADKKNVVTIEIGAGTDIPTIRYFGERQPFPLIRINKTEAETTRAGDVGIETTGASGLQQIAVLLDFK